MTLVVSAFQPAVQPTYVQVEAQRRIAEDLVGHAFGSVQVVDVAKRSAGRRVDVQARSAAEERDAVEVGTVADDDDVLEVLAASNASQMFHLLLGIDGVCFRDDAVEGYAVGEKIVSADTAFGPTGVLVGTAPECDDDGRHAALVEADGLIETGVQHGRGTTGVLGCAKDGNGIGRLGIVDLRGGVDLVIDPAEPCDCGEQQKQREAAQESGGRASLG